VDEAALGALVLVDGAARDLVRAGAVALRALDHEAGRAAMIRVRISRTIEVLDGAATRVRIRMPDVVVTIVDRVVTPTAAVIPVEVVMIGEAQMLDATVMTDADRTLAVAVMTGGVRIATPVQDVMIGAARIAMLGEVAVIGVGRAVRRIEGAMIGVDRIAAVVLPQGRTPRAVQVLVSAATIADAMIAGAGMTGAAVADPT
jgi:hypothetical protein